MAEGEAMEIDEPDYEWGGTGHRGGYWGVCGGGCQVKEEKSEGERGGGCGIVMYQGGNGKYVWFGLASWYGMT